METSLDVDSNPKIELPEELIAILQYNFDGVDSGAWWQEQVQSYALILLDPSQAPDRASMDTSSVGCWFLIHFKTRYGLMVRTD